MAILRPHKDLDLKLAELKQPYNRIAKGAGINLATLNGFRRGNNIRLYTAQKLADYAGKPLEYFGEVVK